MPSAAILIRAGVACFGQGSMRVPPLPRSCRVIDGRTNQGMMEHHSVAELNESVILECVRRCFGDTKAISRPPDDPRVARRVSCYKDQQPAGVWGEPRKPPTVALLDLTGQSH